MSRSQKKNPAGGVAVARSDKYHKQHTSRVTRHENKRRIKAGKEVMAFPHEMVDQYAGPKDGHKWYGQEWAERCPSIIRK